MEKKNEFEKNRERDRERDRDRERPNNRVRDRRDHDKEKGKYHSRSPYNRSHSKSRSHSYHNHHNTSYSHFVKYNRHSSRSPRMRYRKKTSRDNSAENQGNVLYISNLPQRVRNEDIKERFEKYGKVVDFNIVREPLTKLSRGFGFISYESSKSCQEAIARLDKTAVDDNIINVEVSKRAKPHKPTPGVYLGPKSENYRRRNFRRDFHLRPLSRSRSRDYIRDDSRSRSRKRHSRSRSRSNFYRHGRK